MQIADDKIAARKVGGVVLNESVRSVRHRLIIALWKGVVCAPPIVSLAVPKGGFMEAINVRKRRACSRKRMGFLQLPPLRGARHRKAAHYCGWARSAATWSAVRVASGFPNCFVT